jgi:hypothetical protein
MMNQNTTDTGNDVRGICSQITPSGRDHRVLQAIPDQITVEKLKSINIFSVATWEERTLMETGKFEVTKEKMRKLKIDILGLCEMRRKEEGLIESDKYNYIYSGEDKH